MGAVLIGLTSYVPTYLEGSLDVSPLLAAVLTFAAIVAMPRTPPEWTEPPKRVEPVETEPVNPAAAAEPTPA